MSEVGRLEEIRERLEKAQARYADGDMIGSLCRAFVNEDVPYLLSEIDRLRGEKEHLERWRKDVADALGGLPDGGQYRNDAIQRIDRLQKERKRLREALSEVEEMTYSARNYAVYAGLGSDEPVKAENIVGDVNRRARQALEETQEER